MPPCWLEYLLSSVHTPLPSFSTSFSKLLWFLKLGCGLLLLNSSSVSRTFVSSWREKVFYKRWCFIHWTSLPRFFSRLTGSSGLVVAQVITLETKMNIFRDLKFSISAWRPVVKDRKRVEVWRETTKPVRCIISLITHLLVIAHVASSICCCVALSEMLYTTMSHSSRRSRSLSRVGDYQKRWDIQSHIVRK